MATMATMAMAIILIHNSPSGLRLQLKPLATRMMCEYEYKNIWLAGFEYIDKFSFTFKIFL
jgi:hypothetical protein